MRCVRVTSTITVAVLLWTATSNAAENALPIVPTRTVSFETDEGTWLSLDVSPITQEIVFDLLGDIYLLPPRGGAAKPLLTGMAYETQPVFSPDGKHIAFISDRTGDENVWIANKDGSGARPLGGTLAEGQLGSPAWSPDGQHVYVTRSVHWRTRHKIWAFSVKDGIGQPMSGSDPATDSFSEQDIALSSDGKHAYYAFLPGQGFWMPEAYWRIVRRDLSSGVTDTLINPDRGAVRPVLSPDGRLMAYAARERAETELRLRNLATGEDVRLAGPVTSDQQESSNGTSGLMPGYDFTPDGKAIVISYGGKIHRIDVATRRSEIIPFKARVNLDLGPSLKLSLRDSSGPVRARVIQSPAISPDGRTLAFTAFGKLYTAPVANPSSGKRVTNTGLEAGAASEHQASWSPDGSRLAYVTWSPAGGHIWSVPAAGGAAQQLTTEPAYYRSPIFTMDGKSVLALRGSAHDRSQGYMDRRELQSTHDVIRIPSAPGQNSPPLVLAHLSQKIAAPSRIAATNTFTAIANDFGRLHLSRDGLAVFVYAPAGLMAVPLAGGQAAKRVEVIIPTVAKDTLAEKMPATDVRLSPDGRWLLAMDAHAQLFLAAVPQSTEAPAIDLTLPTPTTSVRRITDAGADYFSWEDGGRTIAWSIGATYFRRSLESVDFTTPPPRPTSVRGPFAEDGATALQVGVTLPRDTPPGLVVLRGARAATMRGREIIESADIVIENNRIKAIGPRGSVAIPSAAKEIDVAGRVVTPGFIDTHAHWEPMRETIDFATWVFPVNLAYGVTAGLDVMTNRYQLVYEDLINAGVIVGPRAYNVARGVIGKRNFVTKFDAMGELRKYSKFYDTHNIKLYTINNRLQRQLLAQAAQELGIQPTSEGFNLKLGMTLAIDGIAGYEHCLPVAPLYKDVIELFSQTRTNYTPTLLIRWTGPSGLDYFAASQNPLDSEKLNRFTPRPFLNRRLLRWDRFGAASEQDFPRMAEAAAKLFRAGGSVGTGSHGDVQGVAYHWELQAMGSGGLTPHEVLQVATASSAEVIGRQDELGSLEPGKYADLIVFDESPLDDIRNSQSIRYVMKNGRLYNGSDLSEIAR